MGMDKNMFFPKVIEKAKWSKTCIKTFSTLSQSVQSLSRVWLCDPWTAAHQASLSFTNSQSLLKLMSIELVMPSNLCCPLLLLPLIFPSIRIFSNESVFHIVDTLLNEKVLLCVSFSLITLRSLLSDPHTAKDFEKLLFTYLSIPVPEPVSHCLVSELILI